MSILGGYGAFKGTKKCQCDYNISYLWNFIHMSYLTFKCASIILVIIALKVISW